MRIENAPKDRPGNGFSLLEVMMTLAVSGIVTVSLAGVMGWTVRKQTQAMQVVQLEALKKNLVQNLRSEGAWAATVNAAQNLPAMACLQAGAVVACPPNTPTPFALYDANGTLLFDATVGTTGFTPQGNLCPAGVNFDMVNGNDDCPYRFELRWQAVCDPSGTPPCVAPQVLVTGHLFYRPARAGREAVSINEDRYSINGVYVKNTPACTGGAQQVFLYNTAQGATLNTRFVVPVYTKNLYVEAWGGGGGGASFRWTTSQYYAGSAGGTTTFNSPLPVGPVTAAGGPGSSGNTLSNQSWFYSGPWNPIWIWTGVGSCNGSPAAPPNAGLLNGLTSKCTPLASVNNGGQGGTCSWIPDLFQNPARDGQVYGGGGASTGAWITDCATWGIYYDPVSNVNNGGQYASAVFTPATLPPGTAVDITVGAGGIGGTGDNFTACWGVFPIRGGSGANGLVKITWE